MKVVGKLADGSTFMFRAPKVKVTNGFSLGFTTDDYGNLPFEFSFYDSVSTDPFYSLFRNKQGELIFP